MSTNNSMIWYFGSVLVVIAMLLAWGYVAEVGAFPRAFFPGPEQTWEALSKGFTEGYLISETLTTIRRMAQGWVIASLVGILLGTIIGLSILARTYVAPTLEVLRPLPSSALAPLAIIAFGLSDNMILALIAFGAFWPMLLTVVHGTSTVHPRRDEVARSLGLSRFEYAVKIAIPSALPDIMGGLRLGLTVALILAVVGEMITLQGGLGSRIITGARRFNAADIFAGVAVLGTVGFLTNAALGQAERYLLRWQPKFQQGGTL